MSSCIERRAMVRPSACSRRVATGNRRDGFVLMEAVVALTIIALVAIGLLGALGAQVRTADKAVLLLHARSLAEDRITMLRALDYFSLTDVPDSLEAGTFPPPFEAYRWTAQVQLVPREYDLFSAEVAVSVADESYVLRTLLHEPQPQIQGTTGR